MDILKKIFDNDEIFDRYKESFNKSLSILSNYKKLFEIDNFMDLDRSIEKTNEAKITLNFCLSLLENLLVYRLIRLNPLKDEIKFERINRELSYDTLHKKIKEDMTAKDFEKRRDKSTLLQMKDLQKELRDLESHLEILKMEIKQVERLRDTINDEYLAFKKKYDAMIKYAPVI